MPRRRQACFYDHHCPLCKKDTDLDPSLYEVDPVLTKFVAAHFSRSQRTSPNSVLLTSPTPPPLVHAAAAGAAAGAARGCCGASWEPTKAAERLGIR